VPSLLEPVRVASKRIGAKVAAAATNSLAVNDGAASAPNYFDRKLLVTTGLCSTSARVRFQAGRGDRHHSPPSSPRSASRAPVKAVWGGWIPSGLATAFFIMDGVMKLIQPQVVIDATRQIIAPLTARKYFPHRSGLWCW
jgi:hypothetical protein